MRSPMLRSVGGVSLSLSLLVSLTLASGAARAAPPPAAPAPPAPKPAAPPSPPPSSPPTSPPPTPPDASDPSAGDDDAEAPSRPAPKGKAVLWGVVSDAKTGEGVLDAQVKVTAGGKGQALCDLDGRYRLVVEPGTYELRVWYELYRAELVKNVVVKAGEVRRVDVSLSSDQSATQVVVVEAPPDRSSTTALIAARRQSAQVGDAVSAQEMQRSPDRNAADAAKRVVGASVLDGRYVVVRGLGDRYVNALLHGTVLPSPEPERQAVPLDLFPSLILSDLTIVKTFTPDTPGDFTGGSVRVNTREPPEKFQVQASATLGVNGYATFRPRPSYEGGGLDWLGVDDGRRALPQGIPSYKLVRLGQKPDGTMVGRSELDEWGKRLALGMRTGTAETPPQGSGNLVLGTTVPLGNESRFGFDLAATYGRKFGLVQGGRTATLLANGVQGNDYTLTTGTDQVTWGGYLGARLELTRKHELALRLLHSRGGENETRVLEGYNEERQTSIRDTRLRFTSRSLTFGQLAGSHQLEALGHARVDWTASLSLATSDEPNTREAVYTRDAASGAYVWDEGTLSGSHFFAKQEERSAGASVDYTQPLVRDDPTRPTGVSAKLKLGAYVLARGRDFDARRFRFLPRVGVDPLVLRTPQEELFTPENVGEVLQLEEYTRPNDRYTAGLDVWAGYVMTDAAPTRWLRLVLGGRVEVAKQSLRSFDPFAPALTEVAIARENVDLLPSASVVFKTSQATNLRASVTRTLARPQLRELAPFQFTDYFGARDVVGNPELRRTTVTNADLRFELFPQAGEVLALSCFWKGFEGPIEPVILPSGPRGILSYANALGADSAGVELEVRKSLGFATKALEALTVLANVTLVSSRVRLTPEQATFVTTSRRPLAGQSPFVVNAGLDYALEKTGTRARVLYNVVGERLAQVGSNGIPDAYEAPRHLFDVTLLQRLSKHLELRLTAENLFDAPIQINQGAVATSVVRPGPTFNLTATVTN